MKNVGDYLESRFGDAKSSKIGRSLAGECGLLILKRTNRINEAIS